MDAMGTMGHYSIYVALLQTVAGTHKGPRFADEYEALLAEEPLTECEKLLMDALQDSRHTNELQKT